MSPATESREKVLEKIDRIDDSGIIPELRECRFTLACDVSNPFFGPNGAAHVFAPQKGAEPEMVERPVNIRKLPQNGRVPQTRQPVAKRASNGMEVCVIKPTSFEDSREVTETLLLGRAVVLNFEGLDMDLAQRIIDYTCGTCVAIDGNLRKISSYIFIVTPKRLNVPP